MNKKNNRKIPTSIEPKMRLKEMFGYGFTDMAGNLLFCTFSQYIVSFYTKVCGLPEGWAPYSANLILLIACIMNALLSIVWGSIIDKTRTRFGQARPWFLWLCIPFAVMTWLAFFLPSFASGNTPAAFTLGLITYVLAVGGCYTGLSAAMSAVLPNLTNKDEERVKASSFRMVGGSAGAFITAMLTVLIVPAIALAIGGNAESAEGLKVAYWIVIGMWAVVAGLLLYLAFKWMRERNFQPQTHKAIPFKTSIKSLKGNHPWFILAGAFIMLWIAQTTRSAYALEFAEEKLGGSQWAMFINGINIVGMISSILTPMIVTRFKRFNKFNKTSTLFLGLLICCVFGALIGTTQSLNQGIGKTTLFVVFYTLSVFGLQMGMGMFFMMFADTVDYGEWKTHIRAPGLLASVGAAFGIQMGNAFGFFLPSLIKNSTDIYFTFIYFPVIVYAISGAIMILFIPYERKMDMIREDLAKGKYCDSKH